MNELSLDNYQLYLSNLSYAKLCNLYNLSNNENVKYLVYKEVYKRNLPYCEKRFNYYLEKYKKYFLLYCFSGSIYSVDKSLNCFEDLTFKEMLLTFGDNEKLYLNYLNFIDNYLKPYNLDKPFNKNDILSELEFIVLEEIAFENHSSQIIHRRVDSFLKKIYRDYIDKFYCILYSSDYIHDDMVELISNKELKRNILNNLNDLKERERQVILLRFGFEDGHPRTMEEVGKEFNVARERIRQIEAKAMRKLRHSKRVECLKDILH